MRGSLYRKQLQSSDGVYQKGASSHFNLSSLGTPISISTNLKQELLLEEHEKFLVEILCHLEVPDN